MELSLALSLVFLAYNGTQAIMSSVISGSLSYWTLATIYISLGLSAMFASSGIVSKLTPKWSICAGGVVYAAFICANLYPRYYTLIPCAIVLGFGASILWAGEGSYVAYASGAYSAAGNNAPQSSLGLFNGIFFSTFQGSTVIGYLISSLVLGSEPSTDVFGGSTLILFIVYAAICIGGLAGLLILPQEYSLAAPVAVEPRPPTHNKILEVVKHHTLETLMLNRDRRMALLIPMMLYDGLQRGFTFGDFTASVIKPNLGVDMVGYVLAVYAAVNAVCCGVFGKIGDLIGLRIILSVGIVLQGLVFIFNVCWCELFGITTLGDSNWGIAVVWISSVMLGIGDAFIYTVFSNTIIGTFPCKPTAFSNFKLWVSLGYTVAFVWGPYIGIELKSVLIAALLVVAAYFVFILDRLVQPINIPKSGAPKPPQQESKGKNDNGGGDDNDADDTNTTEIDPSKNQLLMEKVGKRT